MQRRKHARGARTAHCPRVSSDKRWAVRATLTISIRDRGKVYQFHSSSVSTFGVALEGLEADAEDVVEVLALGFPGACVNERPFGFRVLVGRRAGLSADDV